MNFAIKLLHEPRHGNMRRVYGYSGVSYLFRWQREAKSYVYQPGSQAEVDDLFKAQGRTTQLYFAPVDAGAVAAETATPPSAELVDVCRRLRLRISEDDDHATVQRLITAYSQGHDTENAIRMLYEAAMVRVGLVPAEVPEAGHFDAQQLEAHVTTFLNQLAEPAAPAPKPAPKKAPAAKKKATKAAPKETPTAAS